MECEGHTLPNNTRRDVDRALARNSVHGYVTGAAETPRNVTIDDPSARPLSQDPKHLPIRPSSDETFFVHAAGAINKATT